MYKGIFKRLPSNYSKEGQTNNEKFHQLVYGELLELKEVFEDVKDSKDMDKAFGQSLDNIGKNVQEIRAGKDDASYRQYIKTKVIANRSQGDMQTLNRVADFLLGSEFLGFNETWQNEGYDDVAGMVGEIKLSLSRIPSIINRVKAGGVKFYWEATAVDGLLWLKSHRHRGRTRYPLCNEWRAGTWWYQQNVGRVKASSVKASGEVSGSEVGYPEVAVVTASEKLYNYHRFAEQLTLEQLVTIDNIIKGVQYDYVKANEKLSGEHPQLMNKIRSIYKSLDIGSEVKMNKVIYPVAGDAIL